jgi:sugar lactone lactonase YvrE
VAQHDYVIANGTGAATRADLNNGLAAIVSNNSGATEPATMYAYQWWADTTTGLLKLRNAANSAWVTVGTLASANLGLLASGSTLTAALGSASTPSITFTGDLNTGFWSPAADTLAASTGGSERLRIDSSGRLLVGTSSSYSAPVPESSTSAGSALQVHGTSSNAANINVCAWTGATARSGSITLGRSGGSGGIGVHSIVSDTQTIGSISFVGSDGEKFVRSARIDAQVDGTPGTDDMPGRLVFSTTANGAASPTERLRITSAGNVGIGTDAPAALAHLAGNTIISKVNIANATYDSISFSVAGEETGPQGLFFSPDGRKMFVTGNSGDDVNEYTLSTPWVVSTATYVTVFSVSGQDTAPADIYFRADGRKMYMVGTTSDVIYQYTLSTPWSVASASYDSVSYSVAPEDLTPTGMFFKPDGLAVYIVGPTNDTVYRYNLSTAWDISTASLAASFNVSSQEAQPNALTFTADGSCMFVLGATGDDVNIYNLTTPWDITTASFVTVFSIALQEPVPQGIYVKPDGTKFYIVGGTNDTVFQYSIPSATIDLTGTTYINGSAEVAQDLTVYGGISSGSIQVAYAGAATTPSIAATGDLNTGFWFPAADTLAASTGGSERMRVTELGQIRMATVNDLVVTSSTDTGFVVEPTGTTKMARSGNIPLYVGRQADDGALVSFRQAGVEEGSISVSGTTVSYNGAHLSRWSQLPDGATREEILRGTVLSNIDEMCNWGEEDNEQLNRMKVSDVEGDPNVSGVFQAWDDDDDTYTDDFYCAMTGDFIIRIAEGTPVHRGQLLMSAGDGTAKPQDDDIIRSKTIAKVTSTNVSCTYEDGSYCVPCVLMAC